MTITLTVEEVRAFERSVHEHYEKLFLESAPEIQIESRPLDHLREQCGGRIILNKLLFHKAIQTNPPPKLLPQV